jgi:hypothetical protein
MQHGGVELACTTELIARGRARASRFEICEHNPPSNKQAIAVNQHARDRNGRLIIFHCVQSINHRRLLCIL